MKKKKITVVICSFMLGIGAASAVQGAENVQNEAEEGRLEYRCASKEEGAELLLSNKEYYAGFSQNDLDYKMQKKDATMEEYLDFASQQTMDFTDEEKALVDTQICEMEKVIEEQGYNLPPLDEIVFVKTTMEEENGVAGYTHGTQIYVSASMLEEYLAAPEEEKPVHELDEFFWHELFHCLTRCNPDFRADMYKLIHFTVEAEDYELPPSVFEYHISNPDVEHHNSHATFRINGEDVECFTDFVTTRHFEQPGDSFFACPETALVPIDGSDVYYTKAEAENFDEVFGTNTGYVVDPEECLADNFSYAMCYGTEGKDGGGYPNPEIIEGIIGYLK